MRTSTLVQATADVVTVVNLRRGDVYKRLEESTYAAATLQFGVVTDVMHNGSDAAIVALEFPQDWSGRPEPKIKTFGTGTDLKLFAAQPEEVQAHFAEVLEGSRKAVDTARDALRKAQSHHGQVVSVVTAFSGELELTAAQTGTPELEPTEDDSAEDSNDTVAPF